MSAQKIEDLPSISTVGMNDVLIVEQTNGATTTTYKGTVGDLLSVISPAPSITNVTWDEGLKELTIEADNLLPNSLIRVDEIPYSTKTYTATDIDKAIVVVNIETGLATGSHEVKVINLANEDQFDLDVN